MRKINTSSATTARTPRTPTKCFGRLRHYARRWIKRDVEQDPELESLSDWVRTIRSLVQGRIHKLKNCVNRRSKSVFKDQEAVKCLSSLHDKYVIVPADKASNNIVFVCKS